MRISLTLFGTEDFLEGKVGFDVNKGCHSALCSSGLYQKKISALGDGQLNC